MGWGYWKYPTVPMVDSWKWFDPRRMTNICERWSKDHTNALQYALFNGDGFESWENVSAAEDAITDAVLEWWNPHPRAHTPFRALSPSPSPHLWVRVLGERECCGGCDHRCTVLEWRQHQVAAPSFGCFRGCYPPPPPPLPSPFGGDNRVILDGDWNAAGTKPVF